MAPDTYQQFLDDLVAWAAGRSDVIGLVALGSTARTSHEPDEFSDHDLFVVTVEGHASALRDDLSWLPRADRAVLTVADTPHGRAVVHDDGHLVELAVFDDAELELARVNDYRVLLDRQRIAERLAAMVDRDRRLADADPHGARRFGELVVQLVVAVGRWSRGEALSANERVRGRAMTDLLALVAAHVPAEREAVLDDVLDDLDPHRRFEAAYPALGSRLGLALEAPLPVTVQTMVDVVDEHIVGRVDGATPEVVAAIRSVLARATRS